MTMVKVLRYAAFGEEQEFAEDPVASPVFHADIASAGLDTPSDTQIEYEGGISRGVKLHRPGFYSPSGNVVYADSVNSMMRSLRWVLGGYQFTSDSPLNKHEMFAVEDLLLPTFSTRIGKDVFEHIFQGCVCNTLQILASDGFVQATPDIIASKDGSGPLDEDVIDKLEDTPPFVFHEVTTSLSGSDQSAIISSLTLNIENGADASAGRSLGSRFPRRIPNGARRVNLEMSIWYENKAQIERVWGDEDGPVVGGSVELPVVINMDSGDDGNVQIEMPRVVWTGVSTQPSGQTRIEQTVNARAYLDEIALADASTVRTEILATVNNDVGSVTA